jgi:hypothetical protein
MIGEKNHNLIDLANRDKKKIEFLEKKMYETKITQLISFEKVAKTIYHFAYTDDFRYHTSILNTIKISSQGDRSKKVLLFRTRKLKMCDILARLTSQWNQLESIVLQARHEHMDDFYNSPEKVRYILKNSPNLKLLNISSEYGGTISIDGWNLVSELCFNLTHIIFYGVAVTDFNIELITQKNKHLVSVDLERCKLTTNRSLRSIFMNSSELQSLRFIAYNTEFKENVFEITPCCLGLKILEIGGYIQEATFNPRNTSLTTVIRQLTELKTLKLSNRNWGKVGEECDILQCCRQLESLDLSDSNIQDNAFKRIPQASIIQKLNLGGNFISFEAIKRIIKKFAQLKYLGITQSNLMTENEINGIFQLFPHITKLQELN